MPVQHYIKYAYENEEASISELRNGPVCVGAPQRNTPAKMTGMSLCLALEPGGDRLWTL